MAPLDRDDRRSRGDGGGVRLSASGNRGRDQHEPARSRRERRDDRGRGVLAAVVGHRDPAHRPRRGPRLARRAPDAHGNAAPRAPGAGAASRAHAAAVVAAGRRRACWRVPDRQPAGGSRSVIEVIALLGIAALFAFGVRKRLALVGTVTLAALFATIAFVIVLPMDASG